MSKPLSASPPSAAGPSTYVGAAVTAKKLVVILSVVATVALALGLGLGLGLRTTPSSIRTLHLPQLQPPVLASTPTGFKARLLRILQQASSSLQTVKTRLFSPGPSDFTFRLGKVDERISEFATRSSEFQRKCLSSQPSVWASPQLPGGIAFPMSFQCKENLGGPGNLTLFFGVGLDNFAYVAELQNPPPSTGAPSTGAVPRMAVLAKAPLDGSAVDVIQIVDDSAATGFYSTSWLYISANKTTKNLELSIASAAAGVGVGCGVRLHSANNLIWASGEFADPFAPNPCSGASVSICALSTSLALSPGGTQDCLSSTPPLSNFYSSITPALSASSVNTSLTWLVADNIVRATGFPAVEDFNTAE